MCECIPASNIACSSQLGIGIAQPTCQVLPDDTTQTNPYFDSGVNTSYWSYKILNLCNNFGTSIYIPIYNNITMDMITVSEFILTCGRFEDVSFTFDNPPGITPPSGTQFVNISFTGRFTQAVTAIFRLNILGNYPAINGTIYATDVFGELLTYNAGYQVPSQPLNPRLSVIKQGIFTASGSQGIIDYTITVTNTGNTDLTSVMISDIISYDGLALTLGTFTTTPPLNVDVSVPSIIRITGDLGDIAMGESVIITYTVPIENISSPNTYSFNSSTTVMNADTQASVDTTVSVPVVQLGIALPCAMDSPSLGTFDLILANITASPSFEVDVTSRIVIPTDIVLQFISFASCIATFEGTGEPVPLNTDISGNVISLFCEAELPPNISQNNLIELRVISSSTDADGSNVLMSVNTVEIANPTEQAFLGTIPALPVVRSIQVTLDTECNNVCDNLFP